MNNDRRSEFLNALQAFVPPGSFVVDDVVELLGDEEIWAFYVRPETIFDADSVYERIVVFLATPRRLVLMYTDTSYEMSSAGELVTTLQAIGIDSIKEYNVVKRRHLEGDHAGELNSLTLRLRWGSAFTQDLQPAACDDPACTNDHGYVGVTTNEDFQMFLDERHDGQYFAQGVDFVRTLVSILGQR